ncbi:hypothetical protein ACSFA3_15900 [Variovorax sp. RHLX14]|uniref:hypothetical protein n=1 Tax=Variovorax sp. RHLX14 TaxID=1259731 RepID=UPI003F46579E
MTSFSHSAPTPGDRAVAVIARTRNVWRIALASPREIARRAPVGYVPVRTLRRRMQALAYSW